MDSKQLVNGIAVVALILGSAASALPAEHTRGLQRQTHRRNLRLYHRRRQVGWASQHSDRLTGRRRNGGV